MNIRYILLLIAITTLISSGLSSCTERVHDHASVEKKTYTCPMHPQIIQEQPGSCPICGMDLVEFDRNNKEEGLTLGATQVALANITTMELGGEKNKTAEGTDRGQLRLNGRVQASTDNNSVVTSRVAGRIVQLQVREAGVSVRKGERLYSIYSEELATLQQEYLVARAQATAFPRDAQFSKIAAAAEHKLKLYGQTEQQIRTLAETGKPSPYTHYAAPKDGTIAELMVTEGQYVEEGTVILRMENYDEVWVVADVYPSEIGDIKENENITILIPGQTPKNARLEFVYPQVSDGSQLFQVRSRIPNNNRQLIPGTSAVMVLSTEKEQVIQVPASAVIRDGTSSHVWVEKSAGKFIPRTVTTGAENATSVEITDGLKAGERLVITGNYLLYSEYVLKKGKHPVAHH